MYKRVKSKRDQKMKSLRSSTVEPILGTLLHFRGMIKGWTKGIDLANKRVLLAATAYNLKKSLAVKIKTATKNAVVLILKYGYFILMISENRKSEIITY